MRRLLLCLVPVLTFVAACGDSRSPNSPTPLPGSTASISGFVSTGGQSNSGDSSGAGMKVSVVGTSLQTVTNSTGRFALDGVPSGNVRLQFSAPGVDAGVEVSNVQQSEVIEMTVVVSTTTALVESQRRSSGKDTELEGRIEMLPGPLPNSVVIAGVTVLTDTNTQYFLNGSPGDADDLEIGLRVHVKGQTNGPNLLALVIQIQNTNPNISVIVNGIVDEFSGNPTAFEFEIDGRLIKGDNTTEFFGNSVFADLDDGVRAEVKGLQRNGFVFAERIHVNTEETPVPPGTGTSASIEGLLTAINGTVLVVDGVTVRTDSSTVFRRGGDDSQKVTDMDLNMTLHVVGDRQTDGSLDARMVQIKGDAVGGKFKITGSAGGVKGTCQVLSFGVNGYDIVTDATTTFLPTGSCASLKSGSKVTVTGIVQNGGTVKATSVQLN